MRTASSSALLALFALAGCASEYDVIGERPDVDPGEVTECEFTGITGTKMSAYDCNPVFTTTGETWAAEIGSVAFHTTEVLGHPFYQIWYVGFPANGQYGQYSLNYAVSGDGTNWDTHPENAMLVSDGGNAWDRDIFDGLQVVWDDTSSRYVGTYQGARVGDGITPSFFGMGVITSPDGVAWTRHPGNPVIDFSALTTASPCWPLSLTASGGAYRSYMAGSDPNYDFLLDPECDIFGDLAACSAACEIYAATATDLSVWTMSGNPVMPTTEWYEKKGVVSAAVAELDGVTYMFYISFEEWVSSGADIISAQGLHFNLATSVDGGLTWIKDPANPLDVMANTSPVELRSVGAQTVGRRIHFWLGDNYDGSSGVGYFILEPDLEAVH
ncbi:MAG: hypothetical protein KC912_20945 [Proteobacteria bacterium]|nr:hypothetical protein [Pseudomonadota bacterium]